MVNILIVDSYPIVRIGLTHYLNTIPNFKVIGDIGNGIEILDFVSKNDVDFIICEVDLPGMNGITALRALKKEYSKVNILMFSQQPEEIYAISTLKVGASGYLPKTADPKLIVDAINAIQGGAIYLSAKMDKEYRHNKVPKSRTRLFKKLSTREIEVLKLLCDGKKNKDVANELNINEKTVSTYKVRLFKKLNVTNIIDLVHQAKHHDLT